MKLLLILAFILIGHSPTSYSDTKKKPDPKDMYVVTALAAGAIHRCKYKNYTERDGDVALEKLMMASICQYESGAMSEKDARALGQELIQVFYESRANPEAFPTDDWSACDSGENLVKAISTVKSC